MTGNSMIFHCRLELPTKSKVVLLALLGVYGLCMVYL